MSDTKYVPLADVKAMLEKEQEKRELSYEQKLALTHVTTFVKLTPTKTNKLIKALMEFEFISMDNAIKIADILPTEPEDVRAIFAKERFTLEKGDVEKILTLVREHI